MAIPRLRPPRPEVLAFLADARDNPADDGLRLIFADWLEENGEPLDQARAELIRCQIEFSRQPPESPYRSEHGRRARALQQKYGRLWLGPLEPWVGDYAHQRGLLAVRPTLAHLRSRALTELAGTEAWAWVEEVALAGAQDGDIARLAGAPLLAGIAALGFTRPGIGPAGAQALAGLPVLARLDRLDLSYNEIGDRGLRVLLSQGNLGRLRILTLSCAGLHAEGAACLAAAVGLPRLERLELWGNRLGNDGAATLAGSTVLAGLRQLDLHSNLIGDDGAAALAASAALAQVQVINLADNQISLVGARRLAASPHLEQITCLEMWGNPVGPAGAEALRQRFGARVHVSGGASLI